VDRVISLLTSYIHYFKSSIYSNVTIELRMVRSRVL